MASSMGLLTAFSTSLGEAPGYTVIMVTTGGLNLGASSIGRLKKLAKPINVSTANTTMMRDGRRMDSAVRFIRNGVRKSGVKVHSWRNESCTFF